MKINQTFRITFVPRDKKLFNNKRRFSVGAWSLHKYIGEKNATKLLNKILTFQGDDAVEKYVIKYRKQGTIILYAK